MKILIFRDFMKKGNSKYKIMTESDLQKNYIYSIYPRDSKVYSDNGFVIIDNGSQGGTHWTCFIVKDNKSYYFDLFGGQPDKFLLNQIPKPKTYHNYKDQHINSKLCGSYCSYFFYLFERMNYYNAFLKRYFEKLTMSIIVFGNSSSNMNDRRIDTSLFVQKPYLRTNYIEANIEEDIDLKVQYRTQKIS